MPAADFTYSIDSSALIHGWQRAYPPKNFAPVWKRIEALIAAGRLRASIEVRKELEKKDDALLAWCKKQEEFCVDIDDEIQDAMADIMGNYPKLVDTAKGKSGADPFVIALANSHDPAWTVVSEERGGSAKKPRIPYVCGEEDVRCITLLELIQEQDWHF
jgi:hypothetical protein